MNDCNVKFSCEYVWVDRRTDGGTDSLIYVGGQTDRRRH